MNKTYFQDIHYKRIKPNILIKAILALGEVFYKIAICSKNFLYEIGFLKEHDCGAYVICVGNLTTGGVGKTPVVQHLANELSKGKRVAIISRGYGSKLDSRKVNIIKSKGRIRYKNGSICGDEVYQLAKNTFPTVVIMTCADRLKAARAAISRNKADIIILDDGFSNRKLKKDISLILIDSKMRLGNEHLLPLGPLREPMSEIKRANEIILVDKGDKNFDEALSWVKSKFLVPLRVCKMLPDKIYNIQTRAQIVPTKSAIAFCAIGQSEQFFDFARQYYSLKEEVRFIDHYQYTSKDIEKLIKLAKKHNIHTFITTQKDEAKIKALVGDIKDYTFCVLELKSVIEDLKLL